MEEGGDSSSGASWGLAPFPALEGPMSGERSWESGAISRTDPGDDSLFSDTSSPDGERWWRLHCAAVIHETVVLMRQDAGLQQLREQASAALIVAERPAVCTVGESHPTAAKDAMQGAPPPPDGPVPKGEPLHKQDPGAKAPMPSADSRWCHTLTSIATQGGSQLPTLMISRRGCWLHIHWVPLLS